MRSVTPEWLTQVPTDWQIVLLRLVARVESGHTPSRTHPEYWVPKDCIHPWFTLADIWQLREGSQRYLGETKEMVSDVGLANSGARLLPENTVVLSRTASVGFAGIMPRPMATTQDFVNFVCGTRLDPVFLLWVLRGMTSEIEKLKRGSTHQTIYMPDVMQFRVPIPPLGVQRAIADFLDRRTAAIDALIRKKERLIELLQEKRQALITQAVTKGLDPNVPMKDSGIEWLGEIPAHWDCGPVYSRYEVQLGKMLSADAAAAEERVPYLRNANVRWENVDASDVNEMEFSARERVKYRLRRGDLLVCEGGANIKVVGRTAIWNDEIEECYYQKALHRLRPTRRGESPRYFMYVMRAIVDLGVFIAEANPNTVFHLTAEKLRARRLPFPPVSEQENISSYLDRHLATLRTLAEKVNDQLARLKEYRQALISAAVTGQLPIPEPEPTP